MKRFQVVVGNIGTVYDGESLQRALDLFFAYKDASMFGQGRALGESVTMFDSGEPTEEHHGSLEE